MANLGNYLAVDVVRHRSAALPVADGVGAHLESLRHGQLIYSQDGSDYSPAN
jgi:hypothetical protein